MILKYKQFIKEGFNNTDPPYYFLRWTSSPEDDKIRNFSGHLQCWVDSEEECYNAREREGDRHYDSEPKMDPVSGMWNYDPEWGISGYYFNDEKSFNDAMENIKDISWFHKEDNNQDLCLLQAKEIQSNSGYDGEDLFRDIDFISYIDENTTYDQIKNLLK